MTIEIAVLLSIGWHPASGRARPAEADARALELALRLGPGHRIHAIHAGDPGESILRDYLGMGLTELTVLRQPAGVDVLPAILAHLERLKPALLLTGPSAEHGQGSGMLPYLLARHLGACLLPAIAEASLDGPRVEALQALPRGGRRRLGASLPCLLIADRAAPAPRQSAFAKARRGRIQIVEATPGRPEIPTGREIASRPRPRRLKIMTGGSAAERLRAATEFQAGRGRLMVDPPAEEAARAIYDYLRAEGIIQMGRREGNQA
jgi:electron transfer flavoprotein beta subunit